MEKKLFLTALIVLSTATVGQAIAQTPSTQCDATLWNHVYHPYRLKVQQQCVSVTGTIERIKSEADGDYHIRLQVDHQYQSMINSGNIQQQAGDLILEPVCEHSITQTDAEPACSNFKGNIQVPPVGTHVMVVGSYVLDTDHYNWAEIHPVTSITSEQNTPEFGMSSIITMVVAFGGIIAAMVIHPMRKMF
jgi:hypothetical protein